MSFRFSEDAIAYTMDYVNGTQTDTGNNNTRNTNVQTGWADMRDFDRIWAFVKCDHTNWTDTLTTLKLQQATSSAGAGAKDLTTSGAGSNYNTTTDTLAAADSLAILEARAEDMDQNNGFRYVRLYAASTGNTGADNLFGVMVTYNANDKHKQLQGAAAAATLVYITPQTTSDKPA